VDSGAGRVLSGYNSQRGHMSWRNPWTAFSISFVGWTILICAGAVTINVAIDPFGISPVQIRAAFNEVKIARSKNDRSVKPFAALNVQPRTVIMGTSRVKQAFDPRLLDGSEYAPAYNAGIDYGHLSEHRQLLEAYIKLRIPLKHLFLELFPFQFAHWVGINELGVAHSYRDLFERYMGMTFSFNTLQKSLETLDANLRPDKWPRSGLYDDLGYSGGPGGGHNGVDFWGPVHFSAASYSDQVAPQNGPFNDVAEIVRLCDEHGIALHMFIAPMHPALLYPEWATGSFYRKWLERLSAYGTVNSFLTANEFRERELSRYKKYWGDPSHISRAAAEKILLDLTRRGGPELAVTLTPNTLPSVLTKLEDDLAHWAAFNPTFVAEFHKAVPKAIVPKASTPIVQPQPEVIEIARGYNSNVDAETPRGTVFPDTLPCFYDDCRIEFSVQFSKIDPGSTAFLIGQYSPGQGGWQVLQTPTHLILQLDGGAAQITVPWSPELGKWHRIEVVKVAKTIGVLVDGEQATESRVPLFLDDGIISSLTFYAGVRPPPVPSPLYGRIEKIKVWRGAIRGN
jgi:hypothetical protein